MKNNKGPVCIVGYPRSGTTLVYHLLMSADVFPVFPFDETHYFSHYYKMYGVLTNYHNLQKLIQDLMKRGIIEDASCFENEVFARFNLSEITYGSVFAVLMEYLSNKQGKVRWVEKTPWHMLYMKEIILAVPDIKFIFLVRDPRAVSISISKAKWLPGAPLLRYASAWKWHMTRAEKDIQMFKERVLTIRYEDVVNNLENTLHRLSSFLKIELNAAIVQKKKIGVIGGSNTSFGKVEEKRAVYSEAVDRWKKFLTKKERMQIDYLLNEFLDKYGYDSNDLNSLPFGEKNKVRCFYSIYSVAKMFRDAQFVKKLLLK